MYGDAATPSRHTRRICPPPRRAAPEQRAQEAGEAAQALPGLRAVRARQGLLVQEDRRPPGALRQVGLAGPDAYERSWKAARASYHQHMEDRAEGRLLVAKPDLMTVGTLVDAYLTHQHGRARRAEPEIKSASFSETRRLVKEFRDFVGADTTDRRARGLRPPARGGEQGRAVHRGDEPALRLVRLQQADGHRVGHVGLGGAPGPRRAGPAVPAAVVLRAARRAAPSPGEEPARRGASASSGGPPTRSRRCSRSPASRCAPC
jgi:hypothetical protein